MARTLGAHEQFALTAGRYAVAISWDHAEAKTLVDVDLQAVVVDHKGCIIDAVYYNNLKAMKCITHSGDEQTGEKAGYDEVIWAGLQKMPPQVKMLIFVVAAYSGGHLRDVKNGQIHVLENSKENEVARFAIERSEEEVDVVAMMLRSESDAWTLHVVDEPAQDGRHFVDVLEPTIGNLIRQVIPAAPKRQKVAFAMEKGSVVDLPKTNDFRNITAGLGWDAAAVGKSVDLDVSVVLLDGRGRQVEAVFFGNLQGSGFTHSGDNLTGEGEGDDETIRVELDAVPSDIQQAYFVVNIYTRTVTFEKVSNAYCRIADSSGNELARYNLREGQRESGLMIARLFREQKDPSRWGFQALGSFCRGSTWKDSVPDILSISSAVGTDPTKLQLRGQSTMMAAQPSPTQQSMPMPMPAPPDMTSAAGQKECCSMQ
eukprot:gnl/TRDRNA2_/TRDRNA2_82186_c0_seq1.p1 gnl/TRDRNA2_/TRDRNA2_82186_c0~~gnl/TRDRNA2_/TRDRNA2_82186_c0_seq1.p1  ORF type:complete len:443 (+),score=86.25 gnl/TRDRNA2_/TRDRNA2_82186_c0_seq1:47-1330(+)